MPELINLDLCPHKKLLFKTMEATFHSEYGRAEARSQGHPDNWLQCEKCSEKVDHFPARITDVVNIPHYVRTDYCPHFYRVQTASESEEACLGCGALELKPLAQLTLESEMQRRELEVFRVDVDGQEAEVVTSKAPRRPDGGEFAPDEWTVLPAPNDEAPDAPQFERVIQARHTIDGKRRKFQEAVTIPAGHTARPMIRIVEGEEPSMVVHVEPVAADVTDDDPYRQARMAEMESHAQTEAVPA